MTCRYCGGPVGVRVVRTRVLAICLVCFRPACVTAARRPARVH